MIYNDTEKWTRNEGLYHLKLWTFRILYSVYRLSYVWCKASFTSIYFKMIVVILIFPYNFQFDGFFFVYEQKMGNNKDRPFRSSCFNLIKERGKYILNWWNTFYFNSHKIQYQQSTAIRSFVSIFHNIYSYNFEKLNRLVE